MCARRTSNARRSSATRDALVDAARRLFGERGYGATTLAEVAELAGVSTGAVYHHWRGKEPLMESVVVAIHRNLASEIAASVRSGRASVADPFTSLERAATVFLRRSHEPAIGRVLLVDAPAVLAERWHELDRRWWHDPTARRLRRAARAGAVDRTISDGYATALLGSLTALGRAVAVGAQTPEDAGAILHTLIGSIREEVTTDLKTEGRRSTSARR